MGAMLNDLGMAAACVLAATLAWAGAAKLGRPADTAFAFQALGVSPATVLARIVPVVELVVAVALIAAPALGGAAALVLLAGFSLVLVRALQRGVEVRCACFGQPGGPTLSAADIFRNGLLAVLAALAVAAGLEPRVPSLLAAVSVGVGVLAAATGLQALRRS